MATMRGSLGRDGVGRTGGGGSVVGGDASGAGASAGRSMRSDTGVVGCLGASFVVLSNEVVVVLCTVVLLGVVLVVLCTLALLVVVLCTVVLLKVVVLSTVVLAVVQMASASTVQLATGPAQSLHARAQTPSAHHDSPATQGLHTRVAALEHMGYRY